MRRVRQSELIYEPSITDAQLKSKWVIFPADHRTFWGRVKIHGNGPLSVEMDAEYKDGRHEAICYDVRTCKDMAAFRAWMEAEKK